MRILPAILALLSTLVALDTALAEQGKDRYHLFNPTPRDEMRELSTDRPDKTESPYSVDAGHIQVEMDVVSYVYDKGADSRGEEWAFFIPNIKVGLLNDVDLQIIPSSYVHTNLRQGGERQKEAGFGDIVARLKVNLWGNDGGDTAFAMMPYIKFPTGHGSLTNDAHEGGVIFPFAFSLGDNGVGLMTQVDFVRNEEDKGYHAEFFNTATVSRALFGELGGYLEVATLISNEDDADLIATFDMGLTYGLSEDVQLDGGVNIGLTDEADDVNPFLGVTFRL